MNGGKIHIYADLRWGNKGHRGQLIRSITITNEKIPEDNKVALRLQHCFWNQQHEPSSPTIGKPYGGDELKLIFPSTDDETFIEMCTAALHYAFTRDSCSCSCEKSYLIFDQILENKKPELIIPLKKRFCHPCLLKFFSNSSYFGEQECYVLQLNPRPVTGEVRISIEVKPSPGFDELDFPVSVIGKANIRLCEGISDMDCNYYNNNYNYYTFIIGTPIIWEITCIDCLNHTKFISVLNTQFLGKDVSILEQKIFPKKIILKVIFEINGFGQFWVSADTETDWYYNNTMGRRLRGTNNSISLLSDITKERRRLVENKQIDGSSIVINVLNVPIDTTTNEENQTSLIETTTNAPTSEQDQTTENSMEYKSDSMNTIERIYIIIIIILIFCIICSKQKEIIKCYSRTSEKYKKKVIPITEITNIKTDKTDIKTDKTDNN